MTDENSPQRQRYRGNGLQFTDTTAVDFTLGALCVSVAKNRSKQSQLDAGGLLMGAGPQGCSGRRWDPSCETKPIRPCTDRKGADRPGGKRGRCRGQACETKPIPPERCDGQVPCGKRVTKNWMRRGPRQNKANCRTRSNGQGSPGLPAAVTRPFVRNEANSPGSER